MVNVSGQKITNVSLKGGEEVLIKYPYGVQALDIVNFGPGIAFLHWDGRTVVVDDPNCERLDAKMCSEVRESTQFREVHLNSKDAAQVQIKVCW